MLVVQTADEQSKRREKRGLLFGAHALPVAKEARQLVVCRQCLLGYLRRNALKVSDELVGAPERLRPAGGQVRVGLTLTFLPLRRPEPSLVGIDRPAHDPAQQHARAVHRTIRQFVNELMELRLGRLRIVSRVSPYFSSDHAIFLNEELQAGG